MTATAFWVIRVAAIAYPRVPSEFDSDQTFRRETARAIGALNGDPGAMPGDLKRIAGDVQPPGWLFCDGSLLSRRDFPALFAAIGEKWGAGDGVTTFRIPSQADLEAPITATPPPQNIIGGSIEPGAPPTEPPPGTPGSGGGNIVTGGRPPDPSEIVQQP